MHLDNLFHNNMDKEFAIADSIGACRSIDKIIKEMEKCQVLCMNCHEELHQKLREVQNSKRL